MDLQVPEGPDFYSTYLLDAPAGHLGEPSRFTLSCQSDERHYRDWMDVAETLEWLEASEPDEPGEPDLAGDDGPGYFFSVPTYELEPVEVLEAGVALSWPVGWPLEVPMTEGEHRLPTEYEDAGPVKAWILLRGEDELGDWCRLTRFEDHPMSLDEHASWERESLIASGFEDEAVMHTIWMVGGELAERIVVTTPGVSEVMHSYLFESAGVRYDLSCYSAYDDNLAWQEIAGSVQPLGAPADPGDELEVVEVPGAGVEVTLPLSWTFELTVEELGTFLPPPYGDVGEVSMLRALEATGPDGAWCNVYAYEQMPMSLDEHADWFASMVSANTDYPATVETSMISLPIGESVRLVEDYSAGEVHVLYLFDLDGARRYLACGATVLPDDAWLSVAQTVAPLESVSPIVPDDAVAWNLSEGFATVVPLSVSEDGGWMSAWCDHSLWLEYADGTFEERLDCRLTDDPVEPAEDQGVPPTETVIIDGGACEWISDYWLLQDDSEYWATAWSMSIEPDGQVLAVAVFGAEALDCD